MKFFSPVYFSLLEKILSTKKDKLWWKNPGLWRPARFEWSCCLARHVFSPPCCYSVASDMKVGRKFVLNCQESVQESKRWQSKLELRPFIFIHSLQTGISVLWFHSNTREGQICWLKAQSARCEFTEINEQLTLAEAFCHL